MKKYFGIYYRAKPNADLVLCEVDGGVCYEAYANESAACALVGITNREAINNGWLSRYEVHPIPSNTLVFDSETGSEAFAG